MRVKLNRAELSAVLNHAERIAPSNSTLDVLKGVLLEATDGKMAVTSSNLEVTLKQTIPCDTAEPGSVVFPAKLFATMLRLLDGESVTLQTNQNRQLAIQSGTATYCASSLPVAEYPELDIPFPEDTVPVTGIPSIAKRTAFAVCVDETKPLMRCVNLIFSNEGLKAIGCDGHRIAAAQGDPKSTGEISMLIPASSLEKLARLVANKDVLQVGTTGKTIMFTKENFTFSARLMEGNPMDAQSVLSMAKAEFTVLTDAEAMQTAVDAVLCVAGEHSKVMLGFNYNRLTLRCTNSNGDASGGMDVVALSGNPHGEYWYNGKQLYQCLRAQNGTMMVDVAQNGVLLMRTDDLVCMQMAMRKPQITAQLEKMPPAKAA